MNRVAFTHKAACELATQLGATIGDGINWTWANGFPTYDAAKTFHDAFDGMETRGIYPDRDRETFSVRFR